MGFLYGFDGFLFDLMGIPRHSNHDEKLQKSNSVEIYPSIHPYGEGWKDGYRASLKISSLTNITRSGTSLWLFQ